MIRIGIIGCGYWGPNYLRHFSQLKGSQVVSCCDLLKRNLDRVKRYFNSVEVTPDYSRVLKDKRTDAVVIATPAKTHYKIAKDALLNSKDVLVEKPLALKYEECRRLIDLAKKKRKILVNMLQPMKSVRLKKEWRVYLVRPENITRNIARIG